MKIMKKRMPVQMVLEADVYASAKQQGVVQEDDTIDLISALQSGAIATQRIIYKTLNTVLIFIGILQILTIFICYLLVRGVL